MAKGEKSWFRRHWILTIIGVVIILAIFGGIMSGDESSLGETNTGETNTEENSAEAPVVVTARDLFIEYKRNEISADINTK